MILQARFLWGMVAVCAVALSGSVNRAIGAPADIEPDIEPAQLEFFETKIRPALVKFCYECHATDSKKIKGGLVLDTREGIRKGGDTGHAVVPGNLEESLLIEAIRYEKDLEMPPDGKLPDDVIADFVRWVKMGAPDPRDGKAHASKKEGIDIEQARQFWALQPVRKPQPPKVNAADWPHNDIDRFVLARLEAARLKPVPDADRHTLLRRVYFDLIGLPPSPQEIEAFVNDSSADALEKVIDRLLESKQFGERWGRHWLDVARFAESTGKERNYTFPYAWRYRDYVIDAFNADKPYDQFVIEQIAGDLLPHDDDQQKAEHLIATGFLALGPKSLNERSRDLFKMDMVDDQIDVSSRAVLGLTVACARCHDHKFDPIPTRDYYAIAGIFKSTEVYYGTPKLRGNRFSSRLLPIAGEGSTKLDEYKKHQKELAALGEKKDEAYRAWRNFRLSDEALALEEAEREMRLEELRAIWQDLEDEYSDKASEASKLVPPIAMAVQDEKDPQDTKIHIRGEPDQLGDQVQRGFLSVIECSQAFEVNERQSGRLELARWMVSPDNPLPARVAVNRIWAHLFGQGIVRTIDNFGQTGERPSHPELLDHLAMRFMELGWSHKKMIREIMLSRAYQLSSQFRRKNYEADPQNVLVWRMGKRRLDAEAIRDAIMTASGRLDLNRPMGSAVLDLGDGDVGRTLRNADFDARSRHRSVYLPIIRDLVPEVLQIFDFAEPSLVVGQRDVTTVPAQALFMMNSDFVTTQSKYTAQRLLEDEQLDDAGRIERAYLLTLARTPTDAERDRAVKYINQSAESFAKALVDAEDSEVEVWASFCQALFASAEFRYLN